MGNRLYRADRPTHFTEEGVKAYDQMVGLLTPMVDFLFEEGFDRGEVQNILVDSVGYLLAIRSLKISSMFLKDKAETTSNSNAEDANG